MAKSESDTFTPRTGQVIQAENGTQYFVCGNNRIKISEHFAAGGHPGQARSYKQRTVRSIVYVGTTV